MGKLCETLPSDAVENEAIVPRNATVDRIRQFVKAGFSQLGAQYFHDAANGGLGANAVPHLGAEFVITGIAIGPADQFDYEAVGDRIAEETALPFMDDG